MGMSDFKYHLRAALSEVRMAFGSLLWPIWRRKRKWQPGLPALTADEIADIIMESHKETE